MKITQSNKQKKFIFIMGGVVSSLGKGIISSSLGCLLRARDVKVFNLKCDPYLNVDPGTMSPYQHGEVYVTKDGGETDLDLGHYERFIDNELTKSSNFTAGKVYQDVLNKERKGTFLGKTIQVVPHITDEIKQKIYEASEATDSSVILIEFGGTIGDIELLPFVEAARQISNEVGPDNFCLIFATLAPYLKANKELKTKPTQHAVKELGSMGLFPDVLVIRSEIELTKDECEKIASFCNVPITHVIQALDVDNIYKIPLKLHAQRMDDIICEEMNLGCSHINLQPWNNFVKKIENSVDEVEIAIVGKYTRLEDAYLSVSESLKLSGYEFAHLVKIKWIDSRKLTATNIKEKLKNISGILVPGGFGTEGIEGKILAANYARINKIPYFGICLGMQIALVEIARNILNIKDATSFEWESNSKNFIIDIIRGTSIDDNKGGTLRLGNFLTTLKENTLAYTLYGSQNKIIERHRHRFEVNNVYKEQLEKAGVIFSGVFKEKNLLEIMEINNHPFFLGVQYHPEFTSRPNKPNPIFKGFVKSAIDFKNNKK